MRIVHISDLHIRNQKYRKEYRAAFDEFYRKIEELEPDLIVNTGDTVHSKLAISPELVDDVAHHLLRTSDVAPYWLILGNHDLNLKNSDRMDAISPIVRAMEGKTAHDLVLLEHGMHPFPVDLDDWAFFWNYDIRGGDDFSGAVDRTRLNIGLYHGSVSGCVTDIGFVMEEGESEVKRFDLMDYVLMGDIHKRQSFREGRVLYAGSLIQQNYGEELVKGFTVWDILSKDTFSTSFVPLTPPGRFHTIQVPSDLDLSDVSVPTKSRIKAIVKGELTPSRRIELEETITKRFAPLEIITPDPTAEKLAPVDIDQVVDDREGLMRDHLREHGATDDEVEAAVKTFRKYEAEYSNEGIVRGGTWRLKRVAWDNMLNYGEGNALDLTKLRGLVGIFAPNASGKSSIFDVMLETLFDRVTKEVPRNIDLVNDNKDVGSMFAEFESDDRSYSLVRSIERISYGQRKLQELKQWGKTSLELTRGEESLTGDSRPETERTIRSIIGTFEDFVMTSMISQVPIFGLPGGADLINCRETDRRKILFRMLDLDIYEKVGNVLKEELKSLTGRLRDLKEDSLRATLKDLEEGIELENGIVRILDEGLTALSAEVTFLRRELERMGSPDPKRSRREIVESESRLEACRKTLENCARRERALWKEIENAQIALGDQLRAEPQGASMTLDDIARELDRLRSERHRLTVETGAVAGRVERGRRSVEVLQDIPCEGKFPTCKFIADALVDVASAVEVKEAYDGLLRKGVELESEISSLQEVEVKHREVSKWEKRVADLRVKLAKLEGSLPAIAAEVKAATIAVMESERVLSEKRTELRLASGDDVERLTETIAQRSRAIEAHKKNREVALRKAGGLEERARTIRHDLDSLADLRGRTRILELVAEMVGKDGLPYRILTLIIPVINAEISKILSGIVKFDVFFEDDPEEGTVSLKVRYGDYKSRPLSLGSGAEKFIAALAVRVALLSVSSLPKTDVLIIDEGFGRLDPEYLESLQRMFEYLRDAFGTVFIVSHVDFMRDIVDHSIEITSRDGYAHVEVQ